MWYSWWALMTVWQMPCLRFTVLHDSLLEYDNAFEQHATGCTVRCLLGAFLSESVYIVSAVNY